MTFLLPVAEPIIAGLTTGGINQWFHNQQHESQNIIGDRQNQLYKIVDKINENQQFRNRTFEMAPKPNLNPSIQQQPIQQQQQQQQQIKEQTTKQKLDIVRKKLKQNQQEESKGIESIDNQIKKERRDLMNQEADLSQQYYKERGMIKANIKPTKKDVQQLKKEFNKDRNIKDFTDQELNEIQEFNKEMRKANLQNNTIDQIMQEIQKEGLKPFDQYDKTDPRYFMRKPIDKKPDNPPGGNDPDPDDNENNNFKIPEDQPTRFDYIQAFQKIMEIIKNKDNQSIEQQHQQIDEITENMDDNKVINIYNMINNIQEQHIPQIINEQFDADQLLSSTITQYP